MIIATSYECWTFTGDGVFHHVKLILYITQRSQYFFHHCIHVCMVRHNLVRGGLYCHVIVIKTVLMINHVDYLPVLSYPATVVLHQSQRVTENIILCVKINICLVIGCPCTPEKVPQTQKWNRLERKHLLWSWVLRHR